MLISAVIADPRHFPIAAIAKIPLPALETRAVVAAVPSNADALPLLPRGHASSKFIDDARDFVSGNARVIDAGETVLCKHVTVAHTAGLNLDAHLPCIGIWNVALDNFEIGARLRNLSRLHWCYCEFCSCHDASYEILN